MPGTAGSRACRATSCIDAAGRPAQLASRPAEWAAADHPGYDPRRDPHRRRDAGDHGHRGTSWPDPGRSRLLRALPQMGLSVRVPPASGHRAGDPLGDRRPRLAGAGRPATGLGTVNAQTNSLLLLIESFADLPDEPGYLTLTASHGGMSRVVTWQSLVPVEDLHALAVEFPELRIGTAAPSKRSSSMEDPAEIAGERQVPVEENSATGPPRPARASWRGCIPGTPGPFPPRSASSRRPRGCGSWMARDAVPPCSRPSSASAVRLPRGRPDRGPVRRPASRPSRPGDARRWGRVRGFRAGGT